MLDPRLTRRAFLQLGALPVLAPLAPLASSLPAAPATDPPSTDALDDALRAFQARAPESSGPGGRLTNHGPMVAEALETLGRPEAIEAFVARYLPGQEAAPPAASPLAASEWREALGRDADFPRWLALFRKELAESGWRDLVRTWVGRLAPGLAGQATHGILRAGHAARALDRGETPARRDELAHGLAYWAATYREVLPGRPPRAGSLRPSQALLRTPLLPSDKRITRGLTVGRLAPLAEYAPFLNAADLVDWRADPFSAINDLCRAFAGAYLANTDTSPIILLHAVTGPSAARLLLPHVDETGRQALLAHAWRAAAGFYAVTALHPPSGAAMSSKPPSPQALVDGAVENGAVHAIKFTEACLREWKVAADPVLLNAAADGIRRLAA